MEAQEKRQSQLISTLLFVLLMCSSLALVAQSTTGISVQGIARDAEKAALGDEVLPFKFEIKGEDSTPYYAETVQIKTDPYGVFSHIIGTGSPVDEKKFNEIPFRQSHMRLVITATYNGTTVTLSDAPFQYSPYAISADNGVPTGTIVAFAGKEKFVPKGWVLCDGRDLSLIDGSGNLMEVLGTDHVPDLRGMFLRGTGSTASNNHTGPDLGAVQEDGFETHTASGTTSSVGNHSHGIMLDTGGGGSAGYGDMITGGFGDDVGANNLVSSNGAGAHDHTVTTTTNGGISETRPVNYGVNYIIKL